MQVLADETDFDAVPKVNAGARWTPAPETHFERLIRETRFPAGLLLNGRTIRLVVAPLGETSARLAFPLTALTDVKGRNVLAAFCTLLSGTALLTGPVASRLPALLVASRKAQSEVSTQLADQVYEALWELLRGFEAAERGDSYGPLRRCLEEDAEAAYHGLLAVLLRLVFVLFAEERGLISDSRVYAQHYAVTGLWQRLREDHARYPDTMEQRFGAWAQLLVLFRLLYEGAHQRDMEMPARQGRLFEPSRWPFLEGAEMAVRSSGADVPRVSDGVVLRVLERLIMLDGERLAYRGLDVEQIGSVYEGVMGYRLQRADERSIVLKPNHVVVWLSELLDVTGKDRIAVLHAQADLKITGKAATAVGGAATEAELLAALDARLSPHHTGVIETGGLYVQPTDERRRSGSHYTPRSLTAPIVRTTLGPVLEALGERPTPAQLLSLKVCSGSRRRPPSTSRRRAASAARRTSPASWSCS